MKDYSTKDIRNVALLGASKSGKTTLAEAMLYEGKVIDRRGTVEDKNTLSDNDELEKLNQRSIYATPLYAEFQNKKINFIDTPGSDDFIGGAYAAMKVCESGMGRHPELHQGVHRRQGRLCPVPGEPRHLLRRLRGCPHDEILPLQGRQRHP